MPKERINGFPETERPEDGLFQCIYCKKRKPASDFNTEHVISQMLGKYRGTALTLAKRQVCRSCNMFFGKELENGLALNSCEGVISKIVHPERHAKRLNVGEKLHITYRGGILDGQRLYFKLSSNEHGVDVSTKPLICIISKNDYTVYDCYTIDTLPDFTSEHEKRLKSSDYPLLLIGDDHKQLIKALNEKGYTVSEKNYHECDKSILFPDCQPNTYHNNIAIKDDNVNIQGTVTVLNLRLAAKNIFNLLCYVYGKEYVLDARFDRIRGFIINETDYPITHISVSAEKSQWYNKDDYSHIIGLTWEIDSTDGQLYLYGKVSWFNKITYSFKLIPWDHKQGTSSHIYKCDNKSKDKTNSIERIDDPRIIMGF